MDTPPFPPSGSNELREDDDPLAFFTLVRFLIFVSILVLFGLLGLGLFFLEWYFWQPLPFAFWLLYGLGSLLLPLRLLVRWEREGSPVA